MPITVTTSTESFTSGAVTTTTTTVYAPDNATTVPTPKALAPTSEERDQLEMHKRMAEVMVTFPSVQTFSLLKNTTAATVDQLKTAFVELIKRNKWLAGKLVVGRNGLTVCEEGHFTVDDLFHVVDGPADYVLPGTLQAQLDSLGDLWTQCTQQFDTGSGGSQLETGCNLCALSLVTLPGGLLMVDFAVSHQLGDGATYYRLSEQLTALANGQPVEDNTWETPSENGFLHPDASDADKAAVTTDWLPAFVERFTTEGELPRRVVSAMINTRNVVQLKKEYVASSGPQGLNCEFISTNDLATAAIADIWSVNNGLMAANMRNRIPEATCSDMGNFERAVPFSTSKVADQPKYVRGVINKDFNCFAPGDVPDMTTCDVGIITNWATLTSFIIPPGTELVCHTPGLPLNMFPMDVAVIFKPVNVGGAVGVIHNCTTPASAPKLAASPLYNRLIAQSAVL